MSQTSVQDPTLFMSGPKITFSDVSLDLGGTSILSNIDFEVQSGQIHCIVGPNGGGKTSLLRSLLGEMPHTGRITVASQGSSVIGYVPQALDFDKTLPITVLDFMAMISQRRAAFLGIRKSLRATVESALARVGLAGKERRKLGDLSGGERQRVLIAQALHPAPALLILDEPMTAMDETGARIVEQLLRDIASAGTTVLWVAHDLDQVRRLSNTVTCVNRTVRFQGPAQMLTAERIAEIFGRTLAS